VRSFPDGRLLAPLVALRPEPRPVSTTANYGHRHPLGSLRLFRATKASMTLAALIAQIGLASDARGSRPRQVESRPLVFTICPPRGGAFQRPQ
jgi:hypothetical protein